MSSSQNFTVYKTLPYNVYARAAGKWDYLLENQFFNSSQTVNITMENYDGLSMTAIEQNLSALPLNFSTTVLPWKWDYYNYLLENHYCFMPVGLYYGVQDQALNTTDWTFTATVDSNFIATNFAESNLIYMNKNFAPASDSWEVGIKFSYTQSTNTQRAIGATANYNGFDFVIDGSRHPKITIANSGSSWNIANSTNTDFTFVDGTIYWVKIVFDGTKYVVTLSTDNWATSTELFNISSTATISSSVLRMGKYNATNYFRGGIYLADTYIKIAGQMWSRCVDYVPFSRQGCTYNYTDDGSAVTLNCFVVNNDETIVLTPDNSYTNGYLLGTVNIPAHTVYSYSETSTSWTQPVLSSNGVIGSGSFAVIANSTYSDNEAWKAFDESTSSYYRCATNDTNKFLEFYCSEKIAITRIDITNANNYYIRNYEFQYSDDGKTWTVLNSGSNTSSSNTTWGFDVTDSGAHNYYRIRVLTASTTSFAIAEMAITATTKTATWTAV